MNPNKIRDFQIARNALKKLTEEEIKEIEDQVYISNKGLLFIEAVHHDGGERYSWYIPRDFSEQIYPEDLLLVEQRVGFGKAVVKAQTYIMSMTKDEHIDNIHPYCQVLQKL